MKEKAATERNIFTRTILQQFYKKTIFADNYQILSTLSRIMRCFSVVLLCCCWLTGLAQNNNNQIDVVTNVSPNFTVNTSQDLESAQTFNNCFTINVKTKNAPCSIFAKANFYTKPAGFTGVLPPVKIQFGSSTSTIHTLLSTLPVLLTNTSQRLFTQLQTSQTHSYNYHLILGPLGYDYIPGNYVYYLTLTMTQP